MSLNLKLNGTLSQPLLDVWKQTQVYLPESNFRLAGLGLAVLPIVIILLNAIRQLITPRRATDPPEVFHWIPIIGSAISYGNDPLKFFFSQREKHGDVFTFILFGRRVTVALGAQGNNFILGGKSRSFNAEEAYTHLTTPVFGKDVVYDVPNEVFMEQKKFVKVGLSLDNLRSYVGLIEEEIDEFINHDAAFQTFQSKSDEWGSFDPLKVISEITILTAANSLQGKEVRAGMDKTFAQLFSDLDGGFTPINFLFPNLPLENYRLRDRAHEKLSQFYVDIISKRRLGGEVEHDMIGSLLTQTYRNGERLKDHQIGHIMIALLMAGQHTSSATGSWTLLHIASNPDIAQALYDEQVERFSSPDGTLRSPTYEEIRALPILDSVIRETLRMHPPIHSIMRKVKDDVPVPTTLSAPRSKNGSGVYIVPQGNYVLASPVVSQMDERVWKDPSTWDPKRWSDPEGTAARAYDTYNDETGEKIDYGFGAVSKGTESPYQPFGAGRHRCIGEQFAYLQVSTLLYTFVRHFEFRMETPIPAHNYHTLILMPQSPRTIFYRRRLLK